MLEENYQDYQIIANPILSPRGRWQVSLILRRRDEERVFTAEDGIEYILEVEAAKEAINLGKNLINNRMV